MLATYNSQLALLLLLIAFSIAELIVSELKTASYINIHEDGYSLSFQCSADVTMDFSLTACTYVRTYCQNNNKSEIKKPGTLVRSRARATGHYGNRQFLLRNSRDRKTTFVRKPLLLRSDKESLTMRGLIR